MFSGIKNYLKVKFRARPIESDERRLFEGSMIPAFGLYGVNKVLFIGVAPYTWHYDRLFRDNGMELFTMDRRPEAAVWGAKHRHHTGDLVGASSAFRTDGFDLVVLMGVVGYGLNEPDQVRDAYDDIAVLLKDGGVLLVACESRFGIDPVAVARSCKSPFSPVPAFCFRDSVRLPDFDYEFYFLARGAESRSTG